MMKRILLLSTFLFATCVFAQSYRVKVETFVGNKSEDEFSFTMSQGETQTKGFDSKLFAKRYRATGYPHKIIQEEEEQKKFERKLDKEASQKPIDRINGWLAAAQAELASFDTKMSMLEGRKEKLSENIKELEKLVEMSSRGASSSFKLAYEEYLKKNALTAEDLKMKKMMNKRPRNSGDVEEIFLGSFCKMTLAKASDKKVMLNIDYSYSRLHSYFYADGNNNSNTITKHPIVERVEKLGVKDLVISVAKPYCFQFTRMPPSKAQSLSEAVADSGIFGDGTNSTAAEADPEATALDAQGLYVSIRKKYAADANKVIRMVITVRPER